LDYLAEIKDKEIGEKWRNGYEESVLLYDKEFFAATK
jgi:hypothetical protein